LKPRAAAAFVLATLAVLPACGGRSGLDLLSAEPATVLDASTPDVGVPPCGPSTCPGCCDAEGACRSGQDVGACGLAGRRCVACDPGVDLCTPDPANPDGQVCFSPCAFVSCKFRCCKPSGECVAGNTDDLCGSTGQLCDDCAARGLVCDASSQPHACVAAP
jgi:hypothetical protein